MREVLYARTGSKGLRRVRQSWLVPFPARYAEVMLAPPLQSVKRFLASEMRIARDRTR